MQIRHTAGPYFRWTNPFELAIKYVECGIVPKLPGLIAGGYVLNVLRQAMNVGTSSKTFFGGLTLSLQEHLP